MKSIAVKRVGMASLWLREIAKTWKCLDLRERMSDGTPESSWKIVQSMEFNVQKPQKSMNLTIQFGGSSWKHL
jgi:hypothetical protein